MRGLPLEALELLGKRTIEPRVSIHIVRCGPKVLVLGVSPDGVRTLTEITDPVEIDLMAGACRKKDSSAKLPSSFAGMFPQTSSAESPRGAA
jgi:flagellar biogenesis protein FliO